MNYDFSLLKKYKIKPTKVIRGKRVMKDTSVLLKNVYDKKEKLVRKFKQIIQTGGSKKKIDKIESEITEIEQLHGNLKNLLFLNNGIIEIFSNTYYLS